MLLLPSHIEIMKEVFDRFDRYHDEILKRQALIMQLRTDRLVVDFIDVDAVKVASVKPKTLTLDQVFIEIEKDEFYEQNQRARTADQINHKEFITWKEFISYFEDYREIEERNKTAAKTVSVKTSKTAKASQKEAADLDPEAELKSLLEKEKERRLMELPKLRPADQIDISEDQLMLIKNVFDKEKVADVVNAVTFFFAIRKCPELKLLSSALARDPEGTSRLPRETFGQVFDRMERVNNGK